MQTSIIKDKRVIVVFWKKKLDSPFEVFSSLKNFCLSYLQFNYNTISNYLSKAKIPYENEEVRIERKSIIAKPKYDTQGRIRKIAPVVRKVMIKDADDEQNDLEYWLSKPVQERAAAVTYIISQSLTKGQRLDKTHLTKTRMQHDTGKGF